MNCSKRVNTRQERTNNLFKVKCEKNMVHLKKEKEKEKEEKKNTFLNSHVLI